MRYNSPAQLSLIEYLDLVTENPAINAPPSQFSTWYDPLRSLQSKGSQHQGGGGLAGLAEKRKETKSQYFTPDKVVAFMWARVKDLFQERTYEWQDDLYSILDNSFGSGRMFQFADPKFHRLVGFDVDVDCVARVSEAAQTAGFEYHFEVGSMEEFRLRNLNVGLVNPPFSINLDSALCEPFASGAYGLYGKKSSHKSHVYALTQAVKACNTTIAVMPRSFESEISNFEYYHYLHAIYRLPKHAFSEEGVDFPMSLFVFGSYYPRKQNADVKIVNLKTLDFDKEQHSIEKLTVDGRFSFGQHNFRRKKLKNVARAVTLPVTGDDRVFVNFSGRKLLLKFKCGLAQGRVMNRVLVGELGYRNAREDGRYPKNAQYQGEGVFDLHNFLAQKHPLAAFEGFLGKIKKWGYAPVVAEGLRRHLERQTRRKRLLLEPLRHTVRHSDGGLQSWLEAETGSVSGVCVNAHKISNFGNMAAEPGDEVFFSRYNDEKYEYRHKNRTGYMPIKEMGSYYNFPDFKTHGDNWVLKHQGLRPGKKKREFDPEFNRLRNLAIKMGLDKWLTWDFQLDDLIEIAMRRGNTVVGWTMGLGKARLSLALCYLLGGRHNLLVVESRLIKEMLNEIALLGIPPSEWQVIENQGQTKKLRRINIISYNKLRKTEKRERFGQVTAVLDNGEEIAAQINRPDKPKFVIADALRRRIHTMICDEVQAIKNITTAQSQACFRVCAKAKYGMTGTPIDNYPRDILPLMQFVGGDGTVWQPYGQWRGFSKPENLENMNYSVRGVDVFKKLFVTLEWVTNEFADDLCSGAKREIPKIRNTFQFRKMIAPLVKRRLMQEPDVARHIKIPAKQEVYTELEWDVDHLLHYYQVSEEFVNWYTSMNDFERKNVGLIAILAKMQAVFDACNFPQTEIAGFDPYPKLTSKQSYVLDKLQQFAEQGHKTILFAQKPDLLDYLGQKLDARGVGNVLFHGKILMDKRIRALDEQFREGPKPVLLASKGTLQAGYNVYQADRIIHYDRAWTPKTEQQANGRALRPQQTKVVRIEYSHLRGSIDDYQGQMCQLKGMSMLAGLDYGDDPGDIDFLHIETILGRFVTEFGKNFGVEIKDLIEQKRKGISLSLPSTTTKANIVDGKSRRIVLAVGE